MKKEMYWKLKAEKRCVVCGEPLPADAKGARCAYCNRKMVMSQQKRYQQLRQDGICVICRIKPARPDRCSCEECGHIIVANNKRFRERMREERRAQREG